MTWMENHVEHEERPEERPRSTLRDLVLGTIVAVLFAAATVVAAILSFDANPAGPVVVVVAAIGGEIIHENPKPSMGAGTVAPPAGSPAV